MKPATSMIFNLLLKKDGDVFIAHCLELDIVSAATNRETVKKEIIELVAAQIDYAFSNNNLDYLYHPAPPSVWEEFYACKQQIEEKINIKSTFSNTPERFVPPWIIARTCTVPENQCYA
ncbi:MAG: hypothetical protein MUP52_08390 [Candidatus Aminicenantes bacterium]|nr:hypothetical protein [Candidatus Aminicenantes bacterium]